MFQISRGIANSLRGIVFTAQRTSGFHTSRALQCNKPTEDAAANEGNSNEGDEQLSAADIAAAQKHAQNDRSKIVPVETSMKYLQSDAYKQTYGTQFVWEQYRRNHKGMYAPRKTRKTCIRQGKISAGNPCPICRDEYLVLDHRNTELLNQFISPQTGKVLSYSKTGLCQKQHLRLMVAVERAKDYGLLTYDVPFREFDYTEYYGKEQEKKKAEQSS